MLCASGGRGTFTPTLFTLPVCAQIRSACPPSPLYFLPSSPPLLSPPPPRSSLYVIAVQASAVPGRSCKYRQAPEGRASSRAGQSAEPPPQAAEPGSSVLPRNRFVLAAFCFSHYISLSPRHHLELKTSKFFSSAVLISFHSAPLGEEVMLPDYPVSPPDG